MATVPPSEYVERRRRLAEKLGPDSLLLLFSPRPDLCRGLPERPFRQEDNLYYLTGVEHPETTLALLPGEPMIPEVLFARDRDPRQEVWTGRIPGHEELAARCGIGEVVSKTKLDTFLAAAFSGGAWGDSDLYRLYRPPGLPRYWRAFREGRAKVWLLLGQRPAEGEPLTPELQLAEKLRRRFPEMRLADAAPLIEELRGIKSPHELEILQQAVDITVAGQKAAMARALTAENEHQVHAAVEFTFLDYGASGAAFPSIVAAGENSTTLHYEANNAPIPREALVLVDVGADVGHYAGDLTRTFPAAGTFSPAQREVYEAVLEAWTACLDVLRPGGCLKDVHLKAVEVLGRELQKIGLISRPEQKQVELYFMHGLGHPLGLAVHDVFDRTRPLEPGMVVTSEPGVYVRKDDVLASSVFRDLPPDEQTAISTALDRYAGIGVRVEDDVLITDGEPRVLSHALPRTVDEIEAYLAEARG